MIYCLSFTIRHRSESLHLCYRSDEDAMLALRQFARDVDASSDGEVIMVEGYRPDEHQRFNLQRRVGFLKRDLVAVENDSLDEDDDPDRTEKPVDTQSRGIGGPSGDQRQAIEAARKIAKDAMIE